MKQKLKYIELFESYTTDGVKIPYSRVDDDGKLNIKFPKSATSVPPELNELTTEVTGSLSIERNTALKTVTGFNELQSVGWKLSIEGNTALTQLTGFESLQSVGISLWINGNTVLQSVTGFNQLQSLGGSLWINGNTALKTVTGFNQLQSVGWDLSIEGNPNLVTLSIPSTLIRSVNYKKNCIVFENKHKFKSPGEFVNSDVVIQDCIDKFNPGLHSDVVVKQIVENVEMWGSDNTKESFYSHIAKNGKPEHIESIPEIYKHLYHSDFNNTGAKSVAKVATGVTYGLF